MQRVPAVLRCAHAVWRCAYHTLAARCTHSLCHTYSDTAAVCRVVLSENQNLVPISVTVVGSTKPMHEQLQTPFYRGWANSLWLMGGFGSRRLKGRPNICSHTGTCQALDALLTMAQLAQHMSVSGCSKLTWRLGWWLACCCHAPLGSIGLEAHHHRFGGQGPMTRLTLLSKPVHAMVLTALAATPNCGEAAAGQFAAACFLCMHMLRVPWLAHCCICTHPGRSALRL